MAGALSKGGLGSWYWGYLPFLFKALPYDTTELFTYSQLREHRAQLPLLASLPENYADLLQGALQLPCCVLALAADTYMSLAGFQHA